MKSMPLIEAMDRVIALQIKVMDRVVEDLIEPIADVGNPEKLIGKEYSSWTPQDLQLLTQIYGTQEPNALSDLIFRRKYEEVLALEEET